MLTREGFNTFRLANTEFVGKAFDDQPSDAGRFYITKPARTMMRYHTLADVLRFATVMVIANDDGGSAALATLVGAPARLVSVSASDASSGALAEFARLRGIDARISIHHGVDADDVDRLDAIAQSEFGDEGVDVVIDDQSRWLEPARRTFERLFPRVRLGGRYLFEGWSNGRQIFIDSYRRGTLPDLDFDAVVQEQIARLGQPVEEILGDLLATQRRQEAVVRQLAVSEHWIEVQRGPASLDRRQFRLDHAADRDAGQK